MRILRYLTRDILLHTVAVSFVLFLVVFAGRFIRYLAEAAVGSLTGDVLLPIMLFKLPGFFEMILPLGLFIGILLSLGRLYAESEMVVLRACGVGPGKLAAFVMVPTAADGTSGMKERTLGSRGLQPRGTAAMAARPPP